MNVRNLALAAIAGAFALIACSNSEADKESTPQPADKNLPKHVGLLTTTANLANDLKRDSLSFQTGKSIPAVQIVLDPATRYQEMDGFGAAVTGSTCFNLMQMTPANRTAFLQETFSQEKGLGFSYIRISIGCSDFSLSEYTCCDTPGIENFALQSEETDYVIPILKEILAIQPNIKIMGSPWTCPKWMKVNNLTDLKPFDSWTSGQLNPKYYADYATYFVKWVQAFERQGIKIYSITPQNEPLNRGNSASLFMGWQEQRDFVKTALGPQMKAAGIQAKIYAFDHNYNYDNMNDQHMYPSKIYQDADAAQYLAGAAFHNYGGNRSELNTVHSGNPDKELVFTETSIGTWNSGRDLSKRLMEDMREVALGTANNWCRGAIVWNLMLDNDRAPNREGGCRTCYGAVDINNSDYKTIIRNSHYYIIGHMSAVVKPGAVRIATKGNLPEGLIASAFENPDGTYAFVVMNPTAYSLPMTLGDGTNQFSHTVPAQGVVSYCWKK